jgi:hypothetical protein
MDCEVQLIQSKIFRFHGYMQDAQTHIITNVGQKTACSLVCKTVHRTMKIFDDASNQVTLRMILHVTKPVIMNMLPGEIVILLAGAQTPRE